jgi:hypothetical protein
MGSELRSLIEKMVSDLDANPLDTHPQRLEEIARTVPHSISPLLSLEPLEKYNCVMHALGLVGKMTEYPHPLRFASTAFVSHLVANVLQPCEPRINAFVVWSSEGATKHVGKLIVPNRAESKWGNGILCAHGIDEIPLRYGDVSGFYDAIEPDSVLDHLHRFIFGEQA